MNPVNIQKNKYDYRYERLVKNIIYESVPQSQTKCLLCNSTLCNCDKKNIYKSKKNQIIYNNLSPEIGKQLKTFNDNKNIVDIKTKHSQISFNNDKIFHQILFPSSTRDQKILKHNFIFYNQDENRTINQNKEKIFRKLRTQYYSNVPSTSQYFIEKNRTPLISYKKLNNSVSGKIVVPSLAGFKINNNNSLFDDYFKDKNQEKQNKNILKPNNQSVSENNFSLEREKKNKFRKIYNIKERKDINLKFAKQNHNSYINIHNKSLNNSLINNNKYYDKNSLNINKCNNKIRKYIICKKSNSNHSQINNKIPSLNNISLNINNNFNYQINPRNIVNFPQQSFEQMNNYFFSHFDEVDNNQNIEMKNFSRLKRKKLTLDNKDNFKLSILPFEKRQKSKINNTKYEKLDSKKIYDNNRLNTNQVNYFANKKTEYWDNKENISNNIIENSLIKEKNNNKELHNKFFEIINKNFNNNNTNIPKSSFNNKIENINRNFGSDINKLKNEELISLLIKANKQIIKLQSKLKNYKKQNSQTIPMKGYKKLNNNDNSKTLIKNNFKKKNSLKININEENFNCKTMKNKNSNYSFQIIKNNQNLTTSNSSIVNKIKFGLFNNLKIPKTKDKIFNQNKYIFALYHMNNKKFQNAIVCFEAETKSSEIKIINNSLFNKYYNESINQEKKISSSIYLIKNNNYYIITGCNCNKFFEYNHFMKKLNQYNDLKYSHSNGSMISYSDNIICLSGDNSKKVELFIQNENKWIELPEMQVERSHFSSCILKNRYLFAFFGYNFSNQIYINSIEYLDLFYSNIQSKCIKNNNINDSKNNFCWKYLEYNYFSNNSPVQKINLVNSIAININNEKIIFLGGKNCLTENDNEGYYQLIIDDTYINDDNEEISCYIEKIKTKNKINYNNIYFFGNNYKYIDDLFFDNILKEPVVAAFDNNYNVHLIKLSTMNHEIYNINK